MEGTQDEEDNGMNGKRRYIYMDVLRIIACLCVIYDHVNEYGYFMFAAREIGSLQYFAELFASIQCKLAVPVFFAISGALMLDREVSWKKLWLERIPRIALVLLVFSAIYYGAAVHAGKAEAGFKTFVFGLYEHGWGYSLWYLYAYLAFLIALPVLAPMARALDHRTMGYLFAAALSFRCLIPGFEALYWQGAHKLHPDFNLAFLTCDIVLFPLMGYYLHCRVQKRTLRRIFPVLCVASILLTSLSCYMTYRDYYKTWVAHTQTYHNLFAPVLSAAVFSGARLLFDGIREDSRPGRVLAEIGKCSFGVYLIHLLVAERFHGLFGLFEWMGGTGVLPLLGSLLYCSCIMLLCLIPIFILRRIPIIRRLIS